MEISSIANLRRDVKALHAVVASSSSGSEVQLFRGVIFYHSVCMFMEGGRRVLLLLQFCEHYFCQQCVMLLLLKYACLEGSAHKCHLNPQRASLAMSLWNEWNAFRFRQCATLPFQVNLCNRHSSTLFESQRVMPHCSREGPAKQKLLYCFSFLSSKLQAYFMKGDRFGARNNFDYACPK